MKIIEHADFYWETKEKRDFLSLFQTIEARFEKLTKEFHQLHNAIQQLSSKSRKLEIISRRLEKQLKKEIENVDK